MSKQRHGRDDPEVPDSDVLDDLRESEDEPETRAPSIPPDAPEADALEQSAPVGWDDEEAEPR